MDGSTRNLAIGDRVYVAANCWQYVHNGKAGEVTALSVDRTQVLVRFDNGDRSWESAAILLPTVQRRGGHLMAAARPNTFNVNGEEVVASLAWRLALRRSYRRYRRGGLGPMGAHARTEQLLRAAMTGGGGVR